MDKCYTFNSQKRQRGSATVWVIVSAVLLLLLAAGGGAWYYYNSITQAGGDIVEVVSTSLPVNTQMVVSIDVTKSGIGLEDQSRIFELLLKTKNFEKLMDEAKLSDFSFDKDFKPWITPKAALALSFIDEENGILVKDENGEPSPSLVCGIFPVRSESKAIETCTKIENEISTNNEVKYSEQEYEGAVIHVCEDSDKAPSWAVARECLFVGLEARDIKACLKKRAAENTLANNAEFKEALGKVGSTEGALVFINLRSIVSSFSLAAAIEQKNIQALTSSLRYLVIGSGIVNGHLQNDGALVVDSKTYGQLGQAIFNEKHNIHFNSTGLHPENSDLFAGINIRMLWDIAKALGKVLPEVQESLNNFVAESKKMNVDFEGDIVGSLSGELSFSGRDIGKAQIRQMMYNLDNGSSDVNQMMNGFSQAPMTFCLGLQDKAKFERFLENNPIVAMLTSSFKTKTVGTTKIYNSPQGVGFAVDEKGIVININEEPESLEKFFEEDAKVKSLSNIAAIKDFAANGILFFYQDNSSIYKQMADYLNSHNSDANMAEIMEILSEVQGKQLLNVSMNKDGIVLFGTSELK